MIDKNDLKGKPILYRDRNGAFRTERVVAIDGNVLTVRTVLKIGNKRFKFPRTRVFKEDIKIKGNRKIRQPVAIGRQLLNGALEEIKWGITRKCKNKPNNGHGPQK